MSQILLPLAPAPIVVSLGIVTDSVALLVGLWRRGTRPDAILFADTGSEHPRTYRYLEGLQDWLREIGFPTVTVLKRRSPIAGDTSLAGECHRKSTLPSLAFGKHSCSIKWKAEVMNRWCRRRWLWKARRQEWAEVPSVIRMIGYDAGPKDARRRKRADGIVVPGFTYCYPLIEWGWTREDCIREIEAAGLEQPGKSSCWMCPAMQRWEIDELAREYPALLAYALAIERRAIERGLQSTVGLGRSFAWRDYLTSDAAPPDVRAIVEAMLANDEAAILSARPPGPGEWVHLAEGFGALEDVARAA